MIPSLWSTADRALALYNRPARVAEEQARLWATIGVQGVPAHQGGRTVGYGLVGWSFWTVGLDYRHASARALATYRHLSRVKDQHRRMYTTSALRIRRALLTNGLELPTPCKESHG